jgi:hypothetical protein
MSHAPRLQTTALVWLQAHLTTRGWQIKKVDFARHDCLLDVALEKCEHVILGGVVTNSSQACAQGPHMGSPQVGAPHMCAFILMATLCHKRLQTTQLYPANICCGFHKLLRRSNPVILLCIRGHEWAPAIRRQ